ncbi:MAG: hypothetical protein IPP39_12490 [Chitinophagaceae bacterium]|nr:hypothetical protein [Chitinophagaceae bacterium]
MDNSRNMIGAIRQIKDTFIQKTFNEWKFNKMILAKEFSLPVSKRRKDLEEVEKQTEALEKELAADPACLSISNTCNNINR